MDKPKTERMGLAVIVVAFIALAQLLYFTYQQRQDTQCQADVNIAFLDTIQQRSAISTANDESFESLIADISTATTQEEVQQAFADFEKRKKNLVELRESFEYPDLDAC